VEVPNLNHQMAARANANSANATVTVRAARFVGAHSPGGSVLRGARVTWGSVS